MRKAVGAVYVARFIGCVVDDAPALLLLSLSNPAPGSGSLVAVEIAEEEE